MCVLTTLTSLSVLCPHTRSRIRCAENTCPSCISNRSRIWPSVRVSLSRPRGRQLVVVAVVAPAAHLVRRRRRRHRHRRSAVHPPQHRPHPVHQDLHVERLAHVVVRPAAEAREHRFIGATRSEHDDGHVQQRAQVLAQLEPIRVGQVAVEQDQVRRLGVHALQRVGPRVGHADRVAFPRERVAQQVRQVRVVVNAQDLRYRVPHSPPS